MSRTAGRVLIVDDEPPLLKMMSAYLRRLGYTVVTAGGTERLGGNRGRAATFAVAVLDATMSGIPVEDLAARMLAANPRLCVIVASGYPVDMAGWKRGSGQGDVSAQAVFAGDAGRRGAEDACHARRRRLMSARK